MEEVISIGFFIQNGAANETFQIFNFETKEVEERPRDEIIVMPPTKVLEIDAYPRFASLSPGVHTKGRSERRPGRTVSCREFGTGRG